ncbi:D-sedoheptulose 7-phosphate isomerase [Butyrivibrio sp. LC3010]|uniref:D-sedoheptulose 7-phosphate isomerase n=1 Tax=Butyrivibrio sp. LC3010 TaxID=1280680 RepID=UPI000400087A|nr:D-sedoheptulose 7-phosphate isomerase [Butyrivibrio sp. LC3010]
MNDLELIHNRILDSIGIRQQIICDKWLADSISQASSMIVDSLKSGGRIIICGNGGSAADAMHFAGEIVGRFQMERDPWPAIALNGDAVAMSAIANDYNFEDVFARQVKGHVKKGDVFVGISTSGNSENVYRAVKTAKEKEAGTIALLGKDGGKIKGEANYEIIIPSNNTARIQECHIMVIHLICELVENKMTNNLSEQ